MSLKDFFYLHKSDRQVLLAFLTVAILALGAVLLLDDLSTEEVFWMDAQAPADSMAVARSIKEHETSDEIRFSEDERTTRNVERFPFDPNTADSTQFLRLGLRPWQIKNIYKYRAAGGIYQTKEDFAQLYGLTLKEYRELEPYIRISADYQPASRFIKRERVERDTLRFPPKINEYETIDLATADTALLMRVPGIGTYYAHEIVKYRNFLGGFAHIDQLDEIDYFLAETKKYFRIDTPPFRRLNLNKLSLNELKRHPYINYYQARAIIDYRRQHGKLKSLDDLSLLPDFTIEAILRLTPYVEF